MLPAATASRSCCCTCVVSRLKTRLKSMVPVRYCCTPSCGGRRGGLDAPGEVLGLFPGSQEAPERDLDLPGGRQDLVLVGRDQLLRPGLLQAHVVLDPAVIQDVPAEAGKDGSDEALGLEQLGQVLGIPTDDAVDGDGGVEGGFGHPDLGALGRHLALGAADVGAAAQQVGRDARGDPGGRVRHRVLPSSGPGPSSGSRSWGGMPSRVQSVSFA